MIATGRNLWRENGSALSKSGLLMLRKTDQINVFMFMVNFMRFVSRGLPLDPVAVLPGMVAKGPMMGYLLVYFGLWLWLVAFLLLLSSLT
jgi:hypothetical protein